MDSSLDRYEEQLYSVFKSFDVNNEEALDRGAVLALCDALQLEQRGAALLDTLFECSAQRVTFGQFRSGLLTVLGADPPAAPVSPVAPQVLAAAAAHSDEDSSGREVAPKFVYGSKKYGRRSRPPRASSAPGDVGSGSRCGPSTLLTPQLPLDHDARIDCEHALRLCRQLRMDGIDPRLVESIFDATPAGETTVGEFFDRLNESLSSSIDRATVASPMARVTSTDEECGAGDEMLTTEAVIEAWERVGIQRARRLLRELGFDGNAMRATALELALERELSAPDELTAAALALAGLRVTSARRRAEDAAAERERLRHDVAEANRRARLLAQEVDDNNSRLEAEAANNLRRTEARHADALRAMETERASERERAVAERDALKAELARRAEVETRLRADAIAMAARCDKLEERAAAAEARAAGAERERTRLACELDAASARAARAEEEARGASGGAAAQLEALRGEHARLRDRCDELCAALDAAQRPPPAPPAPPVAASWRDETDGPEVFGCAPAPTPASADAAVQTDPPAAAASTADDHEKENLLTLVKDLELALEQMREEYERCEDYWSCKLEDERQLVLEEQRAADARLAELTAKVAEYERRFLGRSRAPPLPPIEELDQLERQVAALEREAAEARAAADRAAEDLRRRDAALARLQLQLNKANRRQKREAATDTADCGRDPRFTQGMTASASTGAGAGGHACGGCLGAWRCAAALRARLAAAERGAARLTARLTAADLLVKELYVENCLLPRHAPPL